MSQRRRSTGVIGMFDPYLSEGDVIFAPPGYQRPTKCRESERRFDGNR